MRRWPRTIVLPLLALALGAMPARSQEDPTPPTIGEIQARLGALGDDPAVSEPADARIDALRAARKAAQAAADSRAKAAEFAGRAAAGPEELRQIQEELAKPAETFAPSLQAGANLADLDRELAQAQADLTAAQTELDSIGAELTRRAERLRQIPDELSALAMQIDSLRQQLGQVAAGEAPDEVAEARALQLAAQLDAAKARLAELQAEGTSYETGRELLSARRDRAVRRVAAAEARAKAWLGLVNAQREREARAAAEEAAKVDLARAKTIPALQDIAADIEQIRSELTGPNAAPTRLTEATTDLAEKAGRLRDLEARRIAVRRRFAAGRLDNSQGLFLRRELRTLEDPRVLGRRLDRYQSQYNHVQLRLIELGELELKTSDLERSLAEVKHDLGPLAPVEDVRLATELVGQRRALVRQALDTYEPYANTLEQLILTYSAYMELTRSIRSSIEERVFWVRSVSGSLIPTPSDLADDMEWLLDPQPWLRASRAGSAMVLPLLAGEQGAGVGEVGGAAGLLLMPSITVLLLLAGLVAHKGLRRRSRRPLGQSGRVSQMTMSGTVWKLCLALAASIPLPLALWVVASWMAGAAAAISRPEVITPPGAAAAGLARAAYALFGLGLMREIAQPMAVGAAEFRWPESGLAHLRRELRWFIPFAVIASLLVGGLSARGEARGADATGRMLFVLGACTIAVFYARTLSPKRPLIGGYLKKHRGGLIERTARFWFPLTVALPLVLAAGTLAGYAYTTLQIQRRCADTILFVLLVIIGNSLILRWLQLARRKLAIEAAKARAAAQPEQGAQTADAPREPEPTPEMDITSISLQSRKVLQALVTVVLIVGLFGVWSDVLPALRWFERVQVFPTIKYIDPDAGSEGGTALPALPGQPDQPGQAGGDASAEALSLGAGAPNVGIPAAGTGESGGASSLPARVTLAEVALALLLAMLTFSASRNVPGLLEITVLQRLPLDAASRYAYYTVARYLLIIIGVLAICSTLSISWKSAQWLAAALTFGLAFGLQEIFANFASGLIILFEQPIRVGDTITVGGASGTVTRIRTRATTITDWDNRDVVVPNKIFITEQVVNWTLSDPSMRLILPVGIAYGSDVTRALEILLRVARECPMVMPEPPPKALFLGFGESSLNLELRVFIASIDISLTCQHDLNVRIERAFREAGIEISFPQRDLHLRSIDERVLERLSAPAKDPRTRVDGSS